MSLTLLRWGLVTFQGCRCCLTHVAGHGRCFPGAAVAAAALGWVLMGLTHSCGGNLLAVGAAVWSFVRMAGGGVGCCEDRCTADLQPRAQLLCVLTCQLL